MSSIEPIRPVSELRVEPTVRLTAIDRRDHREREQRRDDGKPAPDEDEPEEDDDRPHVDVRA
jgi:hypothetical protein